MFPFISSLFCQNAALVIPTLALISSSHLASSDIQLPRYLNRVTCSNGTTSKVKHACAPFSVLSPPTTVTFVFLTLIFIHTPCKYDLVYQSSSKISFSYLLPTTHHPGTSNL